MADYRKLYYVLFNAITDAIRVLQAAQQHCEAAVMEEPPPPLRLPEDKA